MSTLSRFRLLAVLPFVIAALGTLLFTSCSIQYGSYLTIPVTDYSKIAFSQDHTKLATATPDGTIQIWDTRTGDLLQQKGIHKQPINSLVFSKDGDTLVSAADDNKAVIWNLQNDTNLELIHGMYDSGRVADAVFSPGDKLLATYQGGEIYVWDVASGAAQKPKRHDANSEPIFSADGESILFVDRGDLKNDQFHYKVTLWNFSKNQAINFPKRGSTPMDSSDYGKYPLTFPTFSDDQSKIYIIEQGPTVKLQTWDVEKQSVVRSIDLAPKAESGIVFRCEFSDDRKRLLLNWSGANGDATVLNIASVWDLETGTKISTLNYPSFYSKAHFLNSSGSIIYTHTVDQKSPFAQVVKLWNVAKEGSFLELVRGQYKDKTLNRNGFGFRVTKSPDGTQLAVHTGTGGILLFDLDQVSPSI